MDMPISKAFVYCPRCGAAGDTAGKNPFTCATCNYQHFFGPCAAVAAVILNDQSQVLFLERQKDPGKGKLGLPGGFVDPGESAEHALAREVLEEIGLTVCAFDYIASFANEYHYRGVILPVTDMFFACRIEDFSAIEIDTSEVAGWGFRTATQETLADMAFSSNRQAVEAYLSR